MLGAGAALILPGTALAHHSYAALHVTCYVLQCYGATERPGACTEVYIAAVSPAPRPHETVLQTKIREEVKI